MLVTHRISRHVASHENIPHSVIAAIEAWRCTWTSHWTWARRQSSWCLSGAQDFISLIRYIPGLFFILSPSEHEAEWLRSRHDHHGRAGQRFPHIHLTKSSTACPDHCVKKKKTSDSAEEDDCESSGGGASMLGGTDLEGIHLLKETGRDWRVREGERSSVEIYCEWSKSGGGGSLTKPSSSCCTAAQHLTSSQKLLGEERTGWNGHAFRPLLTALCRLDLYLLPKLSPLPSSLVSPLFAWCPCPAKRRSPLFTQISFVVRLPLVTVSSSWVPSRKTQSICLKGPTVLMGLTHAWTRVNQTCQCTLNMMNSTLLTTVVFCCSLFIPSSTFA